jgi:Ca2+-binding RTX toxin-like protein
VTSQISTWYQFAVQQIFAESYLDGIAWSNTAQVSQRLQQGNTQPDFPPSGYTRLPAIAADAGANTFSVVAHRPNGATGFSATLLRWANEQGATEYTLAIRSTEFKPFNKGGDRARDAYGADVEILRTGFALGQLAALEDFYANQVLPIVGSEKFFVTGYSLGGHLATVFTETHADRVEAAYVFNSPGRGEILGTEGTTPEQMQQMVALFRSALTSEPDASALTALPPQSRREFERLYQSARARYLSDPGWNPFAASDANIYGDPRYLWAQVVTRILGPYPTKPVFPSRAGLGTPGDALITSIYGNALNNDTQLVANSQIHPSNRHAVFIEGQPLVELASTAQETTDYGNTHAITLLVDSLALQREFQRLDPSLTRERIEAIFSASSAMRPKSFAQLGDPRAAEGDSLEKALLSLRRAFDPSTVEVESDATPGGFGNIANRQAFYNELAALPREGTFHIEVLAGRTAHELVTLAERDDDVGLAVRYALLQLEPFAVVGGDYSSARFPNGELKLAATSGEEGMTDAWIAARAEFLAKMSQYNIANGDLSPAAIGAFFEDRQLGITAGTAAPTRPRYLFAAESGEASLDGFAAGDYLFGSLGTDTLSGNGGKDVLEGSGGADALYGGDDADRLFGGAGNDRLQGGKGLDRLEGGSGFDIYVYGSGHGRDFIFDSDGSGQIEYEGRVLNGGTSAGPNTYTDASGTRYELVANGAGVQTLVIDGVLWVVEFTSGDLGIVLNGDGADQPEPPVIIPTRGYTQLPEEFNTGTPYPADRPAEGEDNESFVRREYVNIFGSDASDLFVYTGHPYGFPGFYGRIGDDVLTLAGPVGSAVADGGAGDDVIDATDSFLAPVSVGTALRIVGGAGDDYLLGGVPGEAIQGDNYWFSDSFRSRPGAYLIDNFVFNVTTAYGDGFGEQDPDSLSRLSTAGRYAYPVFDPNLAGSDDFLYLLSEVYGIDLAIRYFEIEGWFFPAGLDAVLDYVLGPDPSFDDYIDAGGGDDTVNGGSGSDTIIGGDGSDSIEGDGGIGGTSLGAFAARFGAHGDDLIDGEGGADRLTDTLAGSDTLIGGAGDDTIRSAEQSWAQEAGRKAFNDLEGEGGNDVVIATNETREGFDIVFGGAGNDSITAASVGGGVIRGGDGNDTIRASTVVLVAASETRIGDGYFDVDGGAGDDTYRVVNGSIHDGEGDDTLIIALGAKADADAKFFAAATGAAPPPAVPPPPGPFPPGPAPISPFDLDSRGFFPFLDPLFATQLVLRSGDDLVVSASPQLAGQVEFDTLTIVDWFSGPQAPIEHVRVRSGAAEISANELETWGTYQAGTAADEVFAGGEHTDRVLGMAGADEIATAAGDDLIAGGAGNDVLDGGSGNDTYVYNLGDGNDRIHDESGIDRIVFGTGIEPSSISVTLGASRVFLSVGGSTLEMVHAGGIGEGDLPVDRLEFSSGTTIAIADLTGTATAATGSAGGETLAGNGAANTLRGGAGDDLLMGGAGNDVYEFLLGDGIDRIRDEPTGGETNVIRFGPGISPDMLTLGSGSLQIRVGEGGDAIHLESVDANDIFGTHDVDLFVFEDGTQLTYAELVARGLDVFGTPGDDFLTGSNVADRIRGQAGDDLLLDGAGADTYFFARGDGGDTIVGFDAVSADTDELVFSADIAAGNVSIERVGDDILMQLENPADSVRLQGAYAYDVIERIRFGDGTEWSASALRDHAIRRLQPIVGTGRGDVVAGTGGEDLIYGRAGYDRLMGGAGNDAYLVGAMRHRVDQVIERPGDGYDAVHSSASYLLPANVEELHLLGASSLRARGNSLANIVIGNAADNILYGAGGDDLLLDDAGRDRLYGGAGDDVLDGGEGDDWLIGGEGNDTYVHAARGGNDIVDESGGFDAILFGAGIAAADVSVRRRRDDLVFGLAGGNGSATVKGWYLSGDKRVEEVRFADGTVWDSAAIRARVTRGHRPVPWTDGHGGSSSDRESDRWHDAITVRIARDSSYDFTALAIFLQRREGGGYGTMTPQQVAREWARVQETAHELAHQDDDCGGANDSGVHWGHCAGGAWCCDEESMRRGSYGWGSAAIPSRHAAKFAGLGEEPRGI